MLKRSFENFQNQNPKRCYINVFTYIRISKMYFWNKNSKKIKRRKFGFKPESTRLSARIRALQRTNGRSSAQVVQKLLFMGAQAPTFGPSFAFWALKRPFERPSAQFRSKIYILSFKTLILDILSPYPTFLT